METFLCFLLLLHLIRRCQYITGNWIALCKNCLSHISDFWRNDHLCMTTLYTKDSPQQTLQPSGAATIRLRRNGQYHAKERRRFYQKPRLTQQVRRKVAFSGLLRKPSEALARLGCYYQWADGMYFRCFPIFALPRYEIAFSSFHSLIPVCFYGNT
jgi:hypothetical protein